MLELNRFDLQNPREWDRFERLFSAYLAEVCDEIEYEENIADLHDEALNRQLIEQTLRQQNPYFVMQIVSDGQCVGLISYACDEARHAGFINNFYVCPAHRNKGTGACAYRMAETRLKSLGAEQIELVPVEKALRFYARQGFVPSRVTADGEQVYGKRLE